MKLRYWIAGTIIALGIAAAANAQIVNSVVNSIVATTCTNQFVRSLVATGAGTCATVSLTADVSGITPSANGGTGINNSANLTVSSATSVGRGQYQGTNTNDAATAGNIGEYVEASLAFGSALTLTTGTPVTLANTGSLAAGDWDISGTCYNGLGASTTVTNFNCSISATNNVNDGTNGVYTDLNYPTGTVLGAAFPGMTTPVVRKSISSGTTYYLVIRSAFGVSTNISWGLIRARRVR